MSARTSLTAAFVALSVLLIAGCGGDDGGAADTSATASVEDIAYFEQLADALSSTTVDGAALTEQRTLAFDPAKTEEDRKQAGAEFGQSYAKFTTERRDAIAAVTAPGDFAALHSLLARAADETVELAGSVNESLAASPVASDEEYNEVFFEADGSTITQRFRDACSDIQNRAVESGSDVDLGCAD